MVTIDETNKIIEGPIAIILGDFIAILVKENRWEAIHFLCWAEFLVLGEGAIYLSHLYALAADEFGSQLIPCGCQTFAMSTPLKMRNVISLVLLI